MTLSGQLALLLKRYFILFLLLASQISASGAEPVAPEDRDANASDLSEDVPLTVPKPAPQPDKTPPAENINVPPKKTNEDVPQTAPPPTQQEDATEPPAEAVSLPVKRLPEKFNGPPTLRIKTTLMNQGENVIVGLVGPEKFLSVARGISIIEDALHREIFRSNLAINDLPFEDDKPRRIEIIIPYTLTRHHHFKLTLEAEGFESVTLSTDFEVLQPNPASDQRGLTVLISTLPPNDNWDVLRQLGVCGGVQYRLQAGQREALHKGAAAFYVENISHGMLSRYHTERGLWAKTISAAADPGNAKRFLREPSLCSPKFAESFAQEIKNHAEAYSKEHPLFYSLASEPSQTRLSAAFDFDFSPLALAEFQRWLERDVYGTLPALNQTWGTRFEKWSDVIPMSTDEVRARLRDKVYNFSPWVDFRDFQDYHFAHVLKNGAELLRSIDPQAQVGITGAMGAFAFGGWDWSRLSKSLDVVEAYDIGQARSLWRDLAPGKNAFAHVSLALPTDNSDSNPSENLAKKSDNLEKLIRAQAHEIASVLWPFVLEGGPRGVVLWEPPQPLASTSKEQSQTLLAVDGKLSPLGVALAPILHTLTSETGLLLSHCRREESSVAVLYSPASVRVHWLLEADALHGDRWLEAWGANTAGERSQSPYLRLRESWGKLLDDLGLPWRWFSSSQLTSGELLKPDCAIRVLVLPQILALSDLEISHLKKFIEKGGRLVVDAACGHFDEHGKIRKTPPLDELFHLDTAHEPFLPQAMNPLERVKAGELLSGNKLWDADAMRQFPAVFSDEPRWSASEAVKKIAAAEYHRSPVGVVSPAGTFLNLDLSDYLRWRLHPDLQRANLVRALLANCVFQDCLNESRIDWNATKLPVGTQLTWLRPTVDSEQPKDIWVLALRRNPQARLHEYGTESEGNWAFEKPENFTLAFKSPPTIQTLLENAPPIPVPVQKIEGTLDPVEPKLYVLRTAPAESFVVEAPAEVQSGPSGAVVKIKITSAQGKKTTALYRLQVFAPDGTAQKFYERAFYSDDGVAEFLLPLAANDPLGKWTLRLRNVLGGTEQSLKLDVKK